ncbi:MAG: hypothetical protein K8R99_05525 [Actinomycetia bacterium]|nr:hypothetical protein [Actinomycetes bacterium]
MRDRLRIERVVWSVDSRLQDLPRRSRIEKRRELRDNLRSAASDVGATEAIHGLGDTRRLAAEYMAAEYGDGGRPPSWTTAVAVFFGGILILEWLLEAGTSAFVAGVVGSDPNATGTFKWEGIAYVLDDVTFRFTDGHSTSIGGAWTPFTYVLLLLVVVLAGKLWRLIPAWRRHR